MSWIFALLLTAYACFRCVGWVRGQMRWREQRASAPRARPARDIDERAPEDIRRVHEQLDARRRELALRELEIRKAAATDPDAMIGVVRSSRYRVAVRRVGSTLTSWLASLEPEQGTGLEGMRVDADALDRLRQASDWLAREANTIAHTRALEGFELERVLRSADVMAAARQAMWDWQEALEGLARKPYRHEAVSFRAAG